MTKIIDNRTGSVICSGASFDEAWDHFVAPYQDSIFYWYYNGRKEDYSIVEDDHVLKTFGLDMEI